MKLPHKSFSRKWAPDIYTLVSGILIVLAFPPWNFWPLIWVCLVPWFIALKRASNTKQAVVQSVWLGYFMSLGGFYWVAYVLNEFGNVPWILSIAGLQIFCLFGQPQFIVFAPLLKYCLEKFKTRTPLRAKVAFLLLIAFLYTGLDWIIPKLFLDTLGHAFYRARNLRQIADLGGAHLLTFIAFLFNFSLWIGISELKKKKKFQFVPEMAIAVFFIFSGWIYGYFRSQQITDIVAQSKMGFQAAAIQANIGDFDKVASERGVRSAATKIIDTFSEMTHQALQLVPRPDVIIWPETSYPSTFRTPHSSTEVSLDERVESLVREIHVPLLFGGYDHLGKKDFNAFFFLSPDSRLETYRKSILLLFGEYIPGAESIQLIRDLFPQVGNFGKGDGPQAIPISLGTKELPQVLAGPMICYEALFPSFSIESARKGAQFILNITNDSWFGKWGEPQLHIALSVFRSIETRLPMFRATNTGISALILPNGEITHPTEVESATIMNVRVPITESIPTWMKLWGDWFGLFSLVIALISGTLVYYSGRRRF